MLNVVLSLLRVIRYYKIYTQFVTWKFVQNYHLFDFDLVHWLMSLIDILIGRRNVYSPWLIRGIYNYWWLFTSFEFILGNKWTLMFYVANVITFSVFLELLRKFTLLVRYNLNRFQPPRVNQFDIYALLFGGYTTFITRGKLVYRYNVKLHPPEVHQCHSDLWHYLCCVLDCYCSILIFLSW